MTLVGFSPTSPDFGRISFEGVFLDAKRALFVLHSCETRVVMCETRDFQTSAFRYPAGDNGVRFAIVP